MCWLTIPIFRGERAQRTSLDEQEADPVLLQGRGSLCRFAVGSQARLRERVRLRDVPGALALGLDSGLVASQCATPVLAAILTYVMARQDGLAYGAALLFIYALGRGVPVVLAGTFAGVIKQLRTPGKWAATIEKASGIVVLGVGFYFLWIA